MNTDEERAAAEEAKRDARAKRLAARAASYTGKRLANGNSRRRRYGRKVSCGESPQAAYERKRIQAVAAAAAAAAEKAERERLRRKRR